MSVKSGPGRDMFNVDNPVTLVGVSETKWNWPIMYGPDF
jgi:hypothetical protein